MLPFSNRIVGASLKRNYVWEQMSCMEHVKHNNLPLVTLGVSAKPQPHKVCINMAAVLRHKPIFGQNEGHLVQISLETNPQPENMQT